MQIKSDSSRDQIQTTPSPKCPVCDEEGLRLYQDLEDSLYYVPGKWSLSKCTNSKCGLLWLDPRPIEEDIESLYRQYHTHQTTTQNQSCEHSQKNQSPLKLSYYFRRMSTALRQGFLAVAFGYIRILGRSQS